MSNALSLSLPRHWTHGNFANVVMPEKTESAVTNPKGINFLMDFTTSDELTIIVAGIVNCLVRILHLVEGHLICVVMLVC